ncbi:MAG: TIGR03905 family TSCPD domain-containing protein [Clostridia bacterium]|nr:TIGR03905 family TSCPD domain-containing protein [Clostridia bacterium]
MRHNYQTFGTCSREISFDLEDGKVKNVSFVGGCNGNLKAISKLVDGMEAGKLVSMLRGNTCGPRPTSCADQLARAVAEAMEKEGE